MTNSECIRSQKKAVFPTTKPMNGLHSAVTDADSWLKNLDGQKGEGEEK
jgi:hypothetical protein